MHELGKMLATHPRAADIQPSTFGKGAETIAGCAQICTSCADACLAESMVADLVRCIRLNLDCADICATTSRVLTRQTMTEVVLLQEILSVCATACRVCAEECERHAGMHDHCRICAEHCRHCVEICEGLLQAATANARA